MIDIVLVEPEIPPNTGNIARLAAALACPLHLIEPLGFEVSARSVKRAGLDYWEHVRLQVHPDFQAFVAASTPSRLVYTSSFAETLYTDLAYEPGDCLVFGKETAGLDPSLFQQHPGPVVRIPHWGPVRSLNLANAVSIVAYEAMRQLGVSGRAPEPCERAADRPPASAYEGRKRPPRP